MVKYHSVHKMIRQQKLFSTLILISNVSYY